MKSEMDSIYNDQMWTLVDAPEHVTLIRCKWASRKRLEQMVKLKPTRLDWW